MRQLRNCFLIELYSSSLGVLGRPFGQPATRAHAAAATFTDTTTTSASPGAPEGRGRREGETASAAGAGRSATPTSQFRWKSWREREGGRAEVVVAGMVAAGAATRL